MVISVNMFKNRHTALLVFHLTMSCKYFCWEGFTLTYYAVYLEIVPRFVR